MKKATVLIGHGSRNRAAMAECQQFADRLGKWLGHDVSACFLEFADPPIVDGIRIAIEKGAQGIIALPLFLGAAGHQKNDVPTIINWAKKQWPHVSFRYGTPLGAQFHLANVLAERAADAGADNETAVIIVGRGSRDPDSNSEVAKVARLVQEGRDFGRVIPAYYSLTSPRLPDVISDCAKIGFKRVVVVPYLLFTGRIYEKIIVQGEDAAVANQIDVVTTSYLFPHEGVVEAAVRRYEEAVDGSAAMTCDLCKYRNQFVGFETEFGMAQSSDHNHGLRGVRDHQHGINQKINAMLPPRYQGGETVSAEPMGSADLVYAQDGLVAWEAIWEGFCELALAGGPSHRGALLEPGLPADIAEKPHQYGGVVAEIERGVALVTGCETIKSGSAGWVGIQCRSEAMAIWLIRAIIVENVLVRREKDVLFVPASPDYTLQDQIKSIITVVAKTFHYWQEHQEERMKKDA